ncbi:hypothetical protein [Dyadobacter luteus]|uniref:hypothetical protein n=1 Tax=Dyadobacter luteus TaxID=2259619 RepID=UPI0011C03719|nr:hypothetical protein [Dyadobacter luteus]
MKRKQKSARLIRNEKYTSAWYTARNLADLSERLNQLPDAAQAVRQKKTSAPRSMLPMIF